MTVYQSFAYRGVKKVGNSFPCLAKTETIRQFLQEGLLGTWEIFVLPVWLFFLCLLSVIFFHQVYLLTVAQTLKLVW